MVDFQMPTVDSLFAGIVIALRYINIYRTKVLELMGRSLIAKGLEYSVAFHGLILASITFTMVAGMLYATHILQLFETRRFLKLPYHVVFATTRNFTLFSFHPLFMVVGSLFFVGEGVAVFRNRLMVESLSPIMQKTKRTKVRTIHYAIMFAGGCFMMLGVCFIFVSKHNNGESLIPSSPHAMLGLSTIVLITLQGFAGEQKIEDIETKQSLPGKSKNSWHANLGLVLWDLIVCTLSTGLYHLLTFSNLYCAVQFFLLLTWASVHLQMKRKGPEGTQLSAFSDSVEMTSPLSPDLADSQQVSLMDDMEVGGDSGKKIDSPGPIPPPDDAENPHLI
jgi:hypothetical protein